MRSFSRASLWTLTRKSKGSRETEITAFAVMPSVLSPRPVVTTATPVGKRLIASRRAGADLAGLPTVLLQILLLSLSRQYRFFRITVARRPYATTRVVLLQ